MTGGIPRDVRYLPKFRLLKVPGPYLLPNARHHARRNVGTRKRADLGRFSSSTRTGPRSPPLAANDQVHESSKSRVEGVSDSGRHFWAGSSGGSAISKSGSGQLPRRRVTSTRRWADLAHGRLAEALLGTG